MQAKNESVNFDIYNIVYFVFFACCFVSMFLNTTTIDYSMIAPLLKWTKIILVFGILFKIYRDIRRAEYDYAYVICFICCIAVCIAAIRSGNVFFAEYCLLIVGAKNVEFKKLLKWYIILSASLIIFTVLFSLIGGCENYVYHRESLADSARYAMGFIYVTDFGAHVFFTCLAYLYYKNSSIRLLELFFVLLIGIVLYIVGNTRNSSICIALTILIIISYRAFKRNNLLKERFSFSKTKKILFLSAPCIAILMIVFGYIDGININENPLLHLFDKLSAGRIGTIAEAFKIYPISVWGTQLTEVGLGGHSAIGWPANYFFIDDSYASIFFKYGLIGFAAILVLWMLVLHNVKKSENTLSMALLLTVIIHCVVEHHFFDLTYNPFFILAISSAIRNSEKNRLCINVLKRQIACLGIAFIIEIVVLNYGALSTFYCESDSITNYECSMEYVNMADDLKYQPIDKRVVIYVDEISGKKESVTLNLNIFDPITGKKITNCEEKVSILACNIVNNYKGEQEKTDYYLLKEAVLDNNLSDNYVTFDCPDDIYGIALIVEFDQDIAFAINDISFNGRIPFNVLPVRMIIIWLILNLIYLAYDCVKCVYSSKNICNLDNISEETLYMARPVIDKKALFIRVLKVLLLSLGIELIVCNISFWRCLSNEEKSITQCDFYIDGGHAAESGVLYFDDSDYIYIVADNVGVPVNELYFDFSLPTSSNMDFIESGVLNSTVYIKDVGGEEYYELPEIRMHTDVETSKYVSIGSRGEVESLIIRLGISNGFNVALNDIKLNANRPMMFSLVRFMIIYIILLVLVLFRPGSLLWSLSINACQGALKWVSGIVSLCVIALAWFMIVSNKEISMMNSENFPTEIQVIILFSVIVLGINLLFRNIAFKYFSNMSLPVYFFGYIVSVLGFGGLYFINQPIDSNIGILNSIMLFVVGLLILSYAWKLKGNIRQFVQFVAIIFIGCSFIINMYKQVYVGEVTTLGILGAIYKYMFEFPRLISNFPFVSLIMSSSGNSGYFNGILSTPMLGGIVSSNIVLVLLLFVVRLKNKLDINLKMFCCFLEIYTAGMLMINIFNYGINIYAVPKIAIGVFILWFIFMCLLDINTVGSNNRHAIEFLFLALCMISIVFNVTTLFVRNYNYPLIYGNTPLYYGLVNLFNF